MIGAGATRATRARRETCNNEAMTGYPVSAARC